MALSPPVRAYITEYLDFLKGATLYDLVKVQEYIPVPNLYFPTLLSTLGGNLQQQTSQLLYPEDFLTKYQDCYPIMPPDKRFYPTDRSFLEWTGEIATTQIQEFVMNTYWNFWKDKLISTFSKTKPLFTPLFESYSKMVSNFANGEETSSDDYLRTDYPSPYGTLDQSYSTGATSNKGSTTRTGKGADNPDRLVKIKDFAKIVDLFWSNFDDLFIWGGGV